MKRGVIYFLLAVAAAAAIAIPFIRLDAVNVRWDSRIDRRYLRETAGIQFKSSLSWSLGNFSGRLPFWIKPGLLELSFARPQTGSQTPLIRKDFYLAAPFKDVSFDAGRVREPLKEAAGRKCFTNNPFFYMRFKTELPGLEFRQAEPGGKESPGARYFFDADNLGPGLHYSSTPVRMELWLSWQESPQERLRIFGVNNRLYDELMRIVKAFPRGKTLIEPLTSLVFVGDIMLARKIEKHADEAAQKDKSAAYPFSGTEFLLQQADIAVGNLECAVSDKGKPAQGKDYAFRAKPSFINKLKTSGFDVLNLANNHSADYGTEALVDTLERLKKADIAAIGAGRNLDNARAGAVMTLKNGLRLGFLGYTMIVPMDFPAGRTGAGVARVKEAWIKEDISRLKKQCDFLAVQYHWGVEYTSDPADRQKELAHKTIDWGADIVVGHHPHRIQDIEFYKGKFIAYSLGNFIFDMKHRPKVTEGILLLLKLKNAELHQIMIEPVFIENGQPVILSADKAPGKRSREDILKELMEESGL